MPKNPKLDALNKQAALLRERIAAAAPGSGEAAKLTRELSKVEKLIDAYTAAANLDKKIGELESKRTEQARKDDTRLKVIVGAAVLADVELKPETRRGVAELLVRAVAAPRDREFLKTKGWL